VEAVAFCLAVLVELVVQVVEVLVELSQYWELPEQITSEQAVAAVEHQAQKAQPMVVQVLSLSSMQILLLT
jgi:hypothetical protein